VTCADGIMVYERGYVCGWRCGQLWLALWGGILFIADCRVRGAGYDCSFALAADVFTVVCNNRCCGGRGCVALAVADEGDGATGHCSRSRGVVDALEWWTRWWTCG